MPTKTKEAIWNFSDIWNDSLLTFDSNRKIEPRDYVYASEIGTAYIDRYLKMEGRKYSNPPNDRSMRKFQAGNIWEWIVGFVLKRAGILQIRQAKLNNQLPGCLRVSGKLDYVAGGVPDWALAESEVKHLDLPDFLYYASLQIIGQLRAKYKSNPLEENIVEVKSASSFVFDKMEKTNTPQPHHAAQNYFYSLTYNKPGKLVYVCKDDCRIMEFRVTVNDRDAFEYYEKDLRTITEYYNNKQIPPHEPELILDEQSLKFKPNWKVEYSNYLTMLYGYKTPDDFRRQWAATASQYNRVFKRLVDCATVTKANLDVIAEAKKRFPNWDALVEKGRIAKAKGQMAEEEDAE